jgi:hypothetical protein
LGNSGGIKGVRHTKPMSIETKKDSPIGIEASRTSDLAFKETHRLVGKANFYESSVEDVREEIVKHYKIPPENVVVFPEIQGRKREIRIFIILENKQTGERFYADGHVPHAVLLDYIFGKFPKIGIEDRKSLPDDWNHKWKVRKGFIDPYLNGFENFPQTRKIIIREMKTRNQNGLTGEQVDFLKKNPENNEIKLPNWVKSI